MNFPLHLSFKIIAVAPQIRVTDADGRPVCHVRQKLFKFKEAVEVFTDPSRTRRLCQIKAGRVIDFSATFNSAQNDRSRAASRKGRPGKPPQRP